MIDFFIPFLFSLCVCLLFSWLTKKFPSRRALLKAQMSAEKRAFVINAIAEYKDNHPERFLALQERLWDLGD